MKRTLENLYIAETTVPEETPLERLAASGEFQDADPVDAEDAEDPAEDGGN